MGTIDVGTVSCTAGRLTVNSLLLATPAYLCTDLSDLWVPSSPLRGQNVLIPGAIGRLATPRRRDEVHHSLPMVISGVVDDVGAEYTDPWAGLEANLADLETALDPPAPPTATVAASLTMPSGAVRTASVQVDGIKVGIHVGPVFRCTLELTIPAGRFT